MCWVSAIKICEKKSIQTFLFIGFLLFFYPFSAFFTVFLPFLTDVHCYTHTPHLYLSHWTCSHTWTASNNVLFCMSCYYHSHPIIPYLAQILGFWVTGGVKMMSLCHGWGRQPPQTASHIHFRHIQSVWAHWYAVHEHTVSALHSHTHPTWLIFWDSVSLVESTWCDYVMVEAESHLKLLPATI